MALKNKKEELTVFMVVALNESDYGSKIQVVLRALGGKQFQLSISSIPFGGRRTWAKRGLVITWASRMEVDQNNTHTQSKKKKRKIFQSTKKKTWMESSKTEERERDSGWRVALLFHFYMAPISTWPRSFFYTLDVF